MTHNVRVYSLSRLVGKPLRLPAVALCGGGLPERFVVELPQGNQMNLH